MGSKKGGNHGSVTHVRKVGPGRPNPPPKEHGIKGGTSWVADHTMPGTKGGERK